MYRIYLLVIAIIFFIFGLGYLIVPQPFAQAAGLESTASGTTDIRATYGGFQLGFGAFLAWSAMSSHRYTNALLALALILGAVGAARIVGLVVDGEFTTFHYIGLGFELPVTIVSALLYRRLTN